MATVADGPPASATDRPLSESYLLKQIQADLAQAIYQQVAWFIGHPNAAVTMDGDSWTAQDQRFRFGFTDSKGITEWVIAEIAFRDPGYTDDTKLVYGPTRMATGPDDNLGAKAARVNNRGREATTHHVESTFEVSQSVESTFTQDFSFDVTLENETTITEGSDEAGGKFEDKLTATFGSHFGNSKSKTTAESTDQTDTIADDIPIDADDDVLITFSNAPIETHVPFSVDGFFGFGIDLTLSGMWDWVAGESDGWHFGVNKSWVNAFRYDRQQPGWKKATRSRTGQDSGQGVGPDWTFSFGSLSDFMDVWYGISTDFPRLDRARKLVPAWWDDAATKANLLSIEDPQRRKIVLAGTQVRTSKTATTMTITSLGGMSEDDADDVLRRIRDGEDVFSIDVEGIKRGDPTSEKTTRAPVDSG